MNMKILPERRPEYRAFSMFKYTDSISSGLKRVYPFLSICRAESMGAYQGDSPFYTRGPM